MSTIADSLTTVARYKAFAEITGTSKDALISMLIIGVSGAVQTYCRRKFKRQAYTLEVYDGTGTKELFLKNTPIDTAQTFTLQVRASGEFNQGDWDTVDSDQYFIDSESGRIYMETGFIEGIQNYRFSYTAGYYLPSDDEYQDGTADDDDLPFDLELAVHMMVNYFYNRRKSQGVSSQRVRDVSITYLKQIESDPEVKSTLNMHRRISYR